eukprot:13146015-Alexandrium_andersonii.AAC.1
MLVAAVPATLLLRPVQAGPRHRGPWCWRWGPRAAGGQSEQGLVAEAALALGGRPGAPDVRGKRDGTCPPGSSGRLASACSWGPRAAPTALQAP